MSLLKAARLGALLGASRVISLDSIYPLKGDEKMPCHSSCGPLIPPQISQKEMSTVESLLCSACRSLESAGFDFGKNPELDRWWHAHEEADAKRRVEEARVKLERERAIDLANTKKVSELTKEERALLKKHRIL